RAARRTDPWCQRSGIAGRDGEFPSPAWGSRAEQGRESARDARGRAVVSAAVDIDAPAGLVAWSVEVGDPGDLLSWLPAGKAFGFLRGGDGLVGWGEAARLVTRSVRDGDSIAADVRELLGSMTVRDDVGVPGS